MSPYLPDIIRKVVARVDALMMESAVDPFHVYFDHGNQSQVSRSVYKAGDTFPLVWLVMPYDMVRGRDFSVFADVTCQIIIAMPTDKDFTQTERDAQVIKPRLIPIYDELMIQLNDEYELSTELLNKTPHTATVWPYWGGGYINSGGDTKNLFENFIDAISITDLRFKIKHKKYCSKPSLTISNN